MKRLIVTICGSVAAPADVKEANSQARKDWSNRSKEKKAPAKRNHRKLTQEEKEEKRLRTERRKILRAAEREAREHDMLMRRLKRVIEKEARASERRRIDVRYKPGREPDFKVVCPRSLFRRTHSQAEPRGSGTARTASDGLRNIVLKFSCRGFGRKKDGTRQYIAGEASRIARYICRLEGLEDVEGAVLTNVISPDMLRARAFSIGQMQQVVGFLNALEEIERATGPSHVYQHVILALPYELGPEGRARAMAKYCAHFERLKLPFCGALHRPDPEGNQRNFHAHIVLGARPFEFRADYDWSFDAEKFTEIISKAARPHLREWLADAFNGELKGINSPIRYSGKSEAERGALGLSDHHKGQKETALERAQVRDDEALQRLLRELVASLSALREKLLKRDAKKSQPLNAEKVSVADPEAPAPGKDDFKLISLDQLFGERDEAPKKVPDKAATVVPPPPDAAPRLTLSREEVVMNSLAIFNGFEVSSHIEALAVALRREPQVLALAMYEGKVQIAFSDQALLPSIKAVAENPLMNLWLKRLAEQLPFDHAGVPANWQYVSVHQGSQLWSLQADHWAAQYGGVSQGGNTAVPGTIDRSIER